MSSRIYLDYCATTPVHANVRNEMLRALDVDFGNPIQHALGREGFETIDRPGSRRCCQWDWMPTR